MDRRIGKVGVILGEVVFIECRLAAAPREMRYRCSLYTHDPFSSKNHKKKLRSTLYRLLGVGEEVTHEIAANLFSVWGYVLPNALHHFTQ